MTEGTAIGRGELYTDIFIIARYYIRFRCYTKTGTHFETRLKLVWEAHPSSPLGSKRGRMTNQFGTASLQCSLWLATPNKGIVDCIPGRDGFILQDWPQQEFPLDVCGWEVWIPSLGAGRPEAKREGWHTKPFGVFQHSVHLYSNVCQVLCWGLQRLILITE